MSSSEATGVQAAIDSRPLSPFQILIVAHCAIVAMIDGFDTQAIALAAPQIAASWKVMPAAFGGVFAAGLLGSLIGAMVFGVAADRFGRKPTLLAAIGLFGMVTLLTPFTTSIEALALVRFLTGIGLGGALPGIISITSEFAPTQRRATIVSLMFCGFPLGAVVGGVAAAVLMPTYGWGSLFVIGSVVPLLLLPVIALVVPESIRFLALSGRRPAVEALLRRMRALEAWDGEMSVADQGQRASIATLFEPGRALGTAILTITFLLSLMLSYFLVNWLPLLARQTGMPIQAAVLSVAALNLGAVAGCLVIGWLADRKGPARPIGWAYALGAIAIACIGLSAGSPAAMLTASAVAGALSIGAQMCVVALGATFYRTALRATGVGWLMGTGRIGAILGPILGGVLIAAGVAGPKLFLVAGAVSLLCALGVFAMGRFVLGRAGGPALAPTPARQQS
jgi:AAHS family 4-hydroxybenzoate transporter-like MFS transporter